MPIGGTRRSAHYRARIIDLDGPTRVGQSIPWGYTCEWFGLEYLMVQPLINVVVKHRGQASLARSGLSVSEQG